MESNTQIRHNFCKAERLLFRMFLLGQKAVPVAHFLINRPHHTTILRCCPRPCGTQLRPTKNSCSLSQEQPRGLLAPLLVTCTNPCPAASPSIDCAPLHLDTRKLSHAFSHFLAFDSLSVKGAGADNPQPQSLPTNSSSQLPGERNPEGTAAETKNRQQIPLKPSLSEKERFTS